MKLEFPSDEELIELSDGIYDYMNVDERFSREPVIDRDFINDFKEEFGVYVYDFKDNEVVFSYKDLDLMLLFSKCYGKWVVLQDV